VIFSQENNAPYAFVCFSSPEEATKAIDMYNEKFLSDDEEHSKNQLYVHYFQSKRARFKKLKQATAEAQKQSKNTIIYIKNLKLDTNRETLKAALAEKYGQGSVKQVHLKKHEKIGRVFAIVQFATAEQAKKLVDAALQEDVLKQFAYDSYFQTGFFKTKEQR
jgi:RNA recognition motif-containing protein